MSMIDRVFGVSPTVLALRSQRTELITANLANADTPHYKAMDISFEDALAAATSGAGTGELARTDSRHLQIGVGSLSSEVGYRIPAQPSMDGNTVETDREHMAFMDNAIRYQASLNFLDRRIKGMTLALKGE
tara:strand:+ start:17231 stop:17626 length:396 start_codon:yes stop_codon:yes gene_type:complete